MKPKWQILNPDPGKIDNLSKTLGISKTVATILVNRGIDEVETASMFLQAKIKKRQQKQQRQQSPPQAERIYKISARKGNEN